MYQGNMRLDTEHMYCSLYMRLNKNESSNCCAFYYIALMLNNVFVTIYALGGDAKWFFLIM
jgi:hypothetical protein